MELKWKTCLRAALTVLCLFLVTHYWESFTRLLGIATGAAMPLLLGGVIAYIINILMNFYERHFFTHRNKPIVQKLRRPICMLAAYASAILIVVVIFLMVLPELIACLQMLLDKLPDAIDALYTWLDRHFSISQVIRESAYFSEEGIDWRTIVTNLGNVLLTGVGGAMGSLISVVSSVFSLVATSLVAVIFSIYLLLGKERILGQIHKLMDAYLPDRFSHRILNVLTVINRSFHSFIVGQCLEAVILGSLCMLGMFIFRFPYATMIGSLVGFTALIPVAGAYIGAAVGAFMIFTVSPIKALLFLVYLLILQQLEGNLIYPRVVGSSIGLPGVWVLAAVTIGGGVLGIVGMLLGVPLAAALYQLLKTDVKNRSLSPYRN